MKITKEDEDDASSKTWQKDRRQSEEKRELQIVKGEVGKRYEDELMEGENKSVDIVQTLEVMELSLQFLFKTYEPVLIVNGQEIILKGRNGSLMERTLTKECIMEDDRTKVYKKKLTQGGIVNPFKVMKKKGK